MVEVCGGPCRAPHDCRDLPVGLGLPMGWCWVSWKGAQEILAGLGACVMLMGPCGAKDPFL